jgi:hypothetical protein
MPRIQRLLLFSWLIAAQVSYGQTYWQQQLRYNIDVTLKDDDHTLDGFLQLSYSNRSPDTLTYLWFHLWPNAYKNDRTAFSEQLLENGRTDFYFSKKNDRGYINQLDFRVRQMTCKLEDHPQYIDVVKVILPHALLPGDSVIITTPFHVQLPSNFSRGGHKGNSYQITQWYPKPAVYDAQGWHPMPYLDQGEFYSEFGDYKVQITLPENYVVAAPGTLLNTNERQWLLQKAAKKPMPAIAPAKPAGKNIVTTTPPKKTVRPRSKTINYVLENAVDFAWFADTSFIVNNDTVQLTSGKTIELFSFYPATEMKTWKKSIQHMKDAIRFRSNVLGDFPYTSMTAVYAPMGFPGGMEYPGITSISASSDDRTLDVVIQHEIGHNWFQAALASNERDFPWIDEGMNTYYDHRYENEKYPGINASKKGFSTNHLNDLLLGSLIAMRKDQPIATTAPSFTPLNYQMVAYHKTARWMEKIEKQLGTLQFDSCMRSYYSSWKFKHPQPDDFFSSLEKTSGYSLTAFRDAITEIHSPAYTGAGKKKLRPQFAWGPVRDTNDYPVSFIPVPGFNQYDGLMAGIAVSNFNFPPQPIRFLLAPQFALRSKQWNGLARISYDRFLGRASRHLQVSVSAMKYSDRLGTDSSGYRINSSFFKIVPSARFWLTEPSPRSSRERWIEWKTYLIGEQGFSYVRRSTDSLFFPTKSTTRNRYIQQLTFRTADYRTLYPYEFQLQWQQGRDFYRFNASGRYYFNYAAGGGLSVRGFAAKFGYIGAKSIYKTFATTAYQPKLTAFRGNEDYTYSNIFLGRNETDGLAGQQVMMRDGDLKIRTDLFMGLQGRSDNWVASVNLNSTLPVALLPPGNPLRLFLDVGTYAEGWDRKSEQPRFLYVGGLQISLLKNVVNVYVPLLYSKLFADNLRSVPEENKFLRKISFSIDIQHLNLRRLSQNQLPF